MTEACSGLTITTSFAQATHHARSGQAVPRLTRTISSSWIVTSVRFFIVVSGTSGLGCGRQFVLSQTWQLLLFQFQIPKTIACGASLRLESGAIRHLSRSGPFTLSPGAAEVRSGPHI